MKPLYVALTGLLVSCGGGGQTTDTAPVSSSTSVPDSQPSSEWSEQEIRDAWSEFTSTSSEQFSFSVIERVGDTFVGARANTGDCLAVPPTSGVAEVFVWGKDQFEQIGSIETSEADSDLLVFADVTDDDVPELLVQEFCQESYVRVFTVGPQGVFLVGQASYFRNGVLSRSEETCIPTCAEGGVDYYKLVWNGQAFDEELDEEQMVTQPLAGRDMSNWDMSGWDLSGVDLNGAILTGANLEGASLAGANLNSANLTSANLKGADLTNADLGNSIFDYANLESADLTGVYTLYASFLNANLLNVKWTVAEDNLLTMRLNGATMPDGSIYDQDPSGGYND